MSSSILTSRLPISDEVRERVDRLELPFNRYGVDPYGVDKEDLAKLMTALGWFYHNYFEVHVYGIEKIPRGRAMLVGNHSGGVAIDGMMFMASCFFELEPPRLAQGMVEKFMGTIPGLAQMAAKMGQFTGLPEHASRLLDDERLIMVFPEGAKGTAKLAHEAHTLVRFGAGFMRLALKGKAPIVPVAFLGGGEAMPTVTNLYALGRLFGVPYIPITKYLLPFPVPATFHILYSEPMMFEGTGNESDSVIRDYVEQVRTRIAWLLEQGRALREGKKKPEELELR